MSKSAWIGAAIVAIGIIGASSGGDSSSTSDSPSSQSDSSSSDASYSSRYTGPTYRDSNGNIEPSDCSAWAASSENPLSYSDGEALCQGFKSAG